MRSLIYGMLLFGGLVQIAPASERKLPYDAIIESDDVLARSGPGRKYYPTSKLKLGDRVTVHRHDPGGWFMIAPPPGSFSWVRAKYVERKGKDRGVISTNRVVIWVGSYESDIREIEQRRLDRGDEVKILGEKELSSEKDPTELWYRIEPPPREWRWIMGQFVTPVDVPSSPGNKSLSSDPLVAGKRRGDLKPPAGYSAAENGIAQDLAPTVKRIPEDAGRTPAGPARREERTLVQREQPVQREERPLAQREQPAQREERAPAQREERTVAKRPERSVPAEVTSMPAVPSRSAAEAEQAELDRLDTRFRAILQKNAAEWDFTQIEQEYIRFRGVATRVSLQQIADARLVTVSKYKKLRADRDDLTRLTSETTRRDTELQVQQRTREESPTSAKPLGFVGAGIVSRSTSNVPGAPPYTLLTPAGRVLAYLAPHPGVDVEPWIGKAAGVNGERTYQKDLLTDVIRVENLSTVRLAP